MSNLSNEEITRQYIFAIKGLDRSERTKKIIEELKELVDKELTSKGSQLVGKGDIRLANLFYRVSMNNKIIDGESPIHVFSGSTETYKVHGIIKE